MSHWHCQFFNLPWE